MEFKDRIRLVRGGPKQQIFADKLGVHITTVQGWEAGKNFPNGDILLRIHKEFGTDINWLLTGEEPYPGNDNPDLPVNDIDLLYNADPFGRASSGLREIFDSGDQIIIDALQSNITAFQISIRRDRQIKQQAQGIKELQEKYDELKKRFDSLEKRGVGSVGAGSGSQAHYGDATREKES